MKFSGLTPTIFEYQTRALKEGKNPCYRILELPPTIFEGQTCALKEGKDPRYRIREHPAESSDIQRIAADNF